MASLTSSFSHFSICMIMFFIFYWLLETSQNWSTQTALSWLLYINSSDLSSKLLFYLFIRCTHSSKKIGKGGNDVWEHHMWWTCCVGCPSKGFKGIACKFSKSNLVSRYIEYGRWISELNGNYFDIIFLSSYALMPCMVSLVPAPHLSKQYL